MDAEKGRGDDELRCDMAALLHIYAVSAFYLTDGFHAAAADVTAAAEKVNPLQRVAAFPAFPSQTLPSVPSSRGGREKPSQVTA